MLHFYAAFSNVNLGHLATDAPKLRAFDRRAPRNLSEAWSLSGRVDAIVRYLTHSVY